MCKEADIWFEGIFISHVIIFLKAGIMLHQVTTTLILV